MTAGETTDKPEAATASDTLLHGSRAYVRPMLDRFRVQVAILVLAEAAAIYLPLLFGLVSTDQVYSHSILTPLPQNASNSFFFCSIASLAALVALRQMLNLPGSWTLAYVLPTLIAANGAAIALMFILRIEYSRYVFVACFLGVTVWLHADQILRQRYKRYVIAVIPGGDMRGLLDIAHVEWRVLTDTSVVLKEFDGVVADLNYDYPADWERLLAVTVLSGVPLYDAKHLKETQSGEVEFEHLSETTFGTVLPMRLYERAKFIIDILVALLLLPVVLPIILIAALIIRLESPGSPFYSQERCGHRGQGFTMHKLRSMRIGGGSGSLITAEQDSRITRFGALIRKYRIDELPQIFNILKGEMSWIGPRPEAMDLAKWYASEIPYYMYRHAVLPGITGWAQVQQGNVGEVDAASQKLRFDFFYIKYFSLWLDVLDGGSTDGTRHVVARYPTVKFMSEPDKGMYDALNKGLGLYAGQAFGVLNADDWFAGTGSLRAIANGLQQADAVQGDLAFWEAGPEGRMRRKWRAEPRPHNGFKSGWMPAHPTFYVRRSLQQRVGLFSLDFKIAADYDWMLRACDVEGARLETLPDVLVNMQLGGASTKGVSAQLYHNREALRSRQRHLGSGIVDWAMIAKPLRKLGQFRLSPGKAVD